MTTETKAPVSITQVVCDGVYLYALCSDNTIWLSALEFPLSWTQIASVPKNVSVHSIGVTLGAVKNLPDEVLFAFIQNPDTLYFWDGSNWLQQWP